MRILVVDQSAEGHTIITKIMEGFESTDKDRLDIQVSLATADNYLSKSSNAHVLILGPGLAESALAIAREVKEKSKDIEMIMVVPKQLYSSATFRLAKLAQVRKVISVLASPLDLLQELLAVDEEFRFSGKARKGKLVVVTQAKGGIGATTLIAALSEISNDVKNHMLLWDFDIETKDLSRGLNAMGVHSHLVSAWITGTRELNRESLREACAVVGPFVSLLPPPHVIAAGMDLAGHPDSIKLVHRIIELARVTQDTLLVDTGGRLSAATGTLLRLADEVVVLIDNSLLGLSAAHAFLETLMTITKGMQDSVRVICCGTELSPDEVRRLIGDSLQLGPSAWSMPSIPPDRYAEKWPGTGSTLYTNGQKQTRAVLREIASLLGICEFAPTVQRVEVPPQAESVGWMRSALQRTNVVSRDL